MPVLQALLLQPAGLCMSCECKMMGQQFREHMESCPSMIAFSFRSLVSSRTLVPSSTKLSDRSRASDSSVHVPQ